MAQLVGIVISVVCTLDALADLPWFGKVERRIPYALQYTRQLPLFVIGIGQEGIDPQMLLEDRPVHISRQIEADSICHLQLCSGCCRYPVVDVECVLVGQGVGDGNVQLSVQSVFSFSSHIS